MSLSSARARFSALTLSTLGLTAGLLVALPLSSAEAVTVAAVDTYAASQTSGLVTMPTGGTAASPSTATVTVNTSGKGADSSVDPYPYNLIDGGIGVCDGYGTHNVFIAVKPGRGRLTVTNSATSASSFDVLTALWESKLATFPSTRDDLAGQRLGFVDGASESDSPQSYYTRDKRFYILEFSQCGSTAVSMNSVLSFVPSPANDDLYSATPGASTATVIGSATPLGSGGYTVSGSNVGATAGDYDPKTDNLYPYYTNANDSQKYGYLRHSLYWTWTPTTSGQVTVSTAGSDFDTAIGLIKVTDVPSTFDIVGAGVYVGKSDNVSVTDSSSRIVARVEANARYVLFLDGAPNSDRSDTAAGTFSLSVSEIAAPANDVYASATVLPSTQTGSISGTTVGAGSETDEPTYQRTGNSVWYRFVAPTTGDYAFDTLATTGEPGAVANTYLGGGTRTATLSSYNESQYNDDATGSTVLSRIVLSMTKNAAYAIAVDGADNSINPTTGPFTLHWTPVDLVPPTTTVTSPVSNAGVLVGTSTITASATVTDFTGVASVEFSIDGNNSVNGVKGAGNVWTATLDVSALQLGVHAVNVTSTDNSFDANQGTVNQQFIIGRVPTAPTGVKAVPGNTTVKVSWLAPTGSFGAAITKYRVSASPGGRYCIAAAAARTCTVSGLVDGTRYTFSVVATNALGTGAPTVVQATPIPVAAPTKIKVVAGPARGGATLTFVAPRGGPVVDYVLQYKVGAKWVTYKDTKSKVTRIAVKGLKANTLYSARLTGVVTVGKATYSSPFALRTK